jgi:type III secretion protein U
MSEDKKRPPTEKRLREARDDGKVARSADVTSAGVLFFAAALLWCGAQFFLGHIDRVFALVWESLADPDASMGSLLIEEASELLLVTLPIAAAASLGCICASVLQGAVTFSFKPLEPKFDAINPANGFKKIFSMRSGIDSIYMLIKVALMSVVLWLVFRSYLPALVGGTARSPELLGSMLWQMLVRLLFLGVAACAVFGVIDFGMQRMLFIRDHRMDDEELKREHKENNGNPEIKAARKELAQELLFGDPRSAVGSANLLIANPTHYAVALRYDAGDVPRVVAKGLDDVAMQLRVYAQEQGVPVFVNPPLARNLYRVPLASAIPREFFEVVATMLHCVDKLVAPLHRGSNE